jgi:hypothetical protein
VERCGLDASGSEDVKDVNADAKSMLSSLIYVTFNMVSSACGPHVNNLLTVYFL